MGELQIGDNGSKMFLIENCSNRSRASSFYPILTRLPWLDASCNSLKTSHYMFYSIPKRKKVIAKKSIFAMYLIGNFLTWTQWSKFDNILMPRHGANFSRISTQLGRHVCQRSPCCVYKRHKKIPFFFYRT